MIVAILGFVVLVPSLAVLGVCSLLRVTHKFEPVCKEKSGSEGGNPSALPGDGNSAYLKHVR